MWNLAFCTTFHNNGGCLMDTNETHLGTNSWSVYVCGGLGKAPIFCKIYRENQSNQTYTQGVIHFNCSQILRKNESGVYMCERTTQ